MPNDHNIKTPQEKYEDQQFLRAFVELRDHESKMAGTKGDIAAVFGRLKDCGWTKKDFEFAKTLEDKDVGQVIADFQRKIRIAKLFGHQIGRQLDLLERDQATPGDRAFEEGLAIGRLRKKAGNPYQPGTEEYQRFQEGVNQGHAEVNEQLEADLNRAETSDDGDEPDDGDEAEDLDE